MTNSTKSKTSLNTWYWVFKIPFFGLQFFGKVAISQDVPSLCSIFVIDAVRLSLCMLVVMALFLKLDARGGLAPPCPSVYRSPSSLQDNRVLAAPLWRCFLLFATLAPLAAFVGRIASQFPPSQGFR